MLRRCCESGVVGMPLKEKEVRVPRGDARSLFREGVRDMAGEANGARANTVVGEARGTSDCLSADAGRGVVAARASNEKDEDVGIVE